MKKIKHSKFRNTGILFELLVKQITADTLNNVEKSSAGTLIRKYFHKDSPLSKELSLYQILTTERFKSENKANTLIDACIKSRKGISNLKLGNLKYALIKEIRENWDLETFFNARIDNYKTLASIYKIFEYRVEDAPKEITNSRYTLLEQITAPKLKLSDNLPERRLVEYKKQDKDIRDLAYNLLIEKFNLAYGTSLTSKQKKLLEMYITNVSNSGDLKEYAINETNYLKKYISGKIKKVTDKIIKIKLNECMNILNNISESKFIKDEHILALLRFHELNNELTKIIGAK